MKAQIHNLKNSLDVEMNPEFYTGLSKLIHELRLYIPHFHEKMDDEFLDYIYENVSDKRCDMLYYSNLGKTKVDEFRKRKLLGLVGDKTVTSTGTLFHSFLENLGNTCRKLPDQTINYSGSKHFVTFKSIFENCGLGNAGYSPKAARESLVESGCIECLGNGKIKFLSKKTKPMGSRNDNIRQISNTIFRYISTQFQNNESRLDGSCVLFEQTMVTDTVPSTSHDACFNHLREHFEPHFFAGQPILESYENDGYKKTHAIGYQTFFFKTEL